MNLIHLPTSQSALQPAARWLLIAKLCWLCRLCVINRPTFYTLLRARFSCTGTSRLTLCSLGFRSGFIMRLILLACGRGACAYSGFLARSIPVLGPTLHFIPPAQNCNELHPTATTHGCACRTWLPLCRFNVRRSPDD
jgi:hypothetical protein